MDLPQFRDPSTRPLKLFSVLADTVHSSNLGNLKMKTLAIFFLTLSLCTNAQAIATLPMGHFGSMMKDFNNLNQLTPYQCHDEQLQLVSANYKAGPNLGAVVYAYGYREYAERIHRIKNGMYQVVRIDQGSGIRFVKELKNGKPVGKELNLNRFGYLDQVQGKKKILGKCYEIGKNVDLRFDGKNYGKIIAIGDEIIAIQNLKGEIITEHTKYFNGNCP